MEERSVGGVVRERAKRQRSAHCLPVQIRINDKKINKKKSSAFGTELDIASTEAVAKLKAVDDWDSLQRIRTQNLETENYELSNQTTFS